MKYNKNKYPILTKLETPLELRKLPQELLAPLSQELRQFLLDINQSNGHFSSSLGVIELTIALHYVYNTPFDSLIWDVGHQTYPHKILTGRRDLISSIRKKKGLHPFPSRNESKYDIFSVGHSSTSISAGLGMAVASKKEMLNRHTICVIGDGAITAGMAFEAINHAGETNYDILIILNDNKISISKNIGALKNHLNKITSKNFYSNELRNNKKNIFHLKFPIIKNLITYIKKHIKNFTSPNSLFEQLGFNYTGPINGHNITRLIQTLKIIKNLKGPQLLHIVTKKGYGYIPKKKNHTDWHNTPKFNLLNEKLPLKKNKITYSEIFGNWLCNVASKDKKLIAITPAMSEGSGMKKFSQQYPNQYFDVAIAEQHAVTFAAGLSIKGYRPVVAIYSTFLQRAYDQVIHDVAMQNLPILFAIDRAGIVGPDGQTHQGAFDLSYLRCIPNIIIMTPSSDNECKLMLHTGYNHRHGPSAVRYPKGEINTDNIETNNTPCNTLYNLPLGKGVIKRHGQNIAILNFGSLLSEAEQASHKLNATLIDMRFVKPLDEKLLDNLAKSYKALITLEENSILGGAGSGVNEFLMKKKILIPVLNLGLPDYFIPHGSQKEIRSDLKLDSIGIVEQIKKWYTKY